MFLVEKIGNEMIRARLFRRDYVSSNTLFNFQLLIFRAYTDSSCIGKLSRDQFLIAIHLTIYCKTSKSLVTLHYLYYYMIYGIFHKINI